MNWKPKIGTFSKALAGAVSLNFSESGGVNCSNQCKLKGNGCYAIHTEKMKPSISVSGERKRAAGFEACCREYQAQIETRKDPIPWIRFSSFGSVPNRPLTESEITAFVSLVRAFPENVPVHFPVESPQKAERFRMIAAAFDLPLVIRESLQSENRLKRDFRNGSIVFNHGETLRDRVKNAREFARTIPGSRVCPAIASTANKRPVKIKCGQGKHGCTACAREDVSLVIYPRH